MIDIIKTFPGDSNFRLFENFPNEIYTSDLHLKQHDSFNSQFLHTCFVAVRNGKVLARASLYNNPHLFYDGKKAFCIGNYESLNSYEVTNKFLPHILSESKKHGAQYLIGPMNGSTWHNYRFSLDHKQPGFFGEPYHHLYYNEQFLSAGLKPVAKYFSSIDTSLKYDDKNVVARENELKESSVTFRGIDIVHYEEELEKIFHFNSIAFRKNFLYTPIEKDLFIQKYIPTKKIIRPEFVILAEDEHNNLIGYFFCIDDVYSTKEKSLIIKTIARHPDEKWKGLGHVIANLIYREAARENYKSVIHAFMDAKGTSTETSRNFSGNIFRNYILYGREIS